MEREILSQSKMLEVSLKGVLREHFLINVMSARHWQDLHQPPELASHVIFFFFKL